ncbi:LAGLIDADG family homing endonuclease [Candidatus Parcubacteria bacterium]|nr:LAGLIDADG family homing endonuclease [Candidatus Parcubacteria bacterium]MBI4099319.1 LAGLIDADG family homing endonuclease [Candidatus Parcubacteria bacterium]MBI4385226.1 LAGLIDADG family homing endonuclease [Candidatus Parcubacteria bacterium]
MAKPGPKPQKHVSTEWTPDLAYAVGLIATDGCLSKDGRHIDFTSKDRDLVSTFRKCLGLENRIGRKVSGFTGHNNYYRVQFGDVHFYQWLRGLGLGPRKSKTISALQLPDEYFFGFLRGCFDGDGSIRAYWDPRWRHSYMFYIQFVSASYPYLQWLQQTIARLTGAIGRIQPSNKAHQLAFAKHGTRTIFARMFPNIGIPYLKRKYLKAQSIFRTDMRHSSIHE